MMILFSSDSGEREPTYEPLYLSCFMFQLLASSLYMILPGETSVEVYSKIFNCLGLRDVCLVYLHWRALTLSQRERYVGLFRFVKRNVLYSPTYTKAST